MLRTKESCCHLEVKTDTFWKYAVDAAHEMIFNVDIDVMSSYNSMESAASVSTFKWD